MCKRKENTCNSLKTNVARYLSILKHFFYFSVNIDYSTDPKYVFDEHKKASFSMSINYRPLHDGPKTCCIYVLTVVMAL